jgi:hypothetical protein
VRDKFTPATRFIPDTYSMIMELIVALFLRGTERYIPQSFLG